MEGSVEGPLAMAPLTGPRVSWEGPWRGPAHDPLGSGVLYTQGLGSPGRAPEGSGVA
jgi:hypothetical protein